MIYGYYCLYPEKADESHDVRRRKRRFERMQELGAPAVILENEESIYREMVELNTSVSKFRENITTVAKQAIQKNYKVVLNDLGYDAGEMYGEYAGMFDGEDFISPLSDMPDNAVLSFIEYMNGKFTAYYEKYEATINQITEVFIKFIQRRVDLHEDAVRTAESLRDYTKSIDDGFTTTLHSFYGRSNKQEKEITVSAYSCRSENIMGWLQEFAFCMAGETNGVYGFRRLEKFFDEDYDNFFLLMNEMYSSVLAYECVGKMLPELAIAYMDRDVKLQIIVKVAGKTKIPDEIYSNAFFSSNIDDVEKLAEAMKAAHDVDALVNHIMSVKDFSCIKPVKYTGKNKKRARAYTNKHKYDNMNGIFRYLHADKFLNEEALLRAIYGQGRSDSMCKYGIYYI